MITLKNINLSSIDLSGIDLRGIKLGLGGRGGGSGDGFPVLPGDVTRWHFGGLTNEMMAAMDDPRIEDADGKGRFLSFKNFAWKGMSGVGGYVTNKDIYEYDLDRYSYMFIENSAKVHDFYIVFELIGYDENFKDGFNLDVRSISQGLKYRKTYTKNGIYIFQYKDEEGLDDLFAIGYNGNGGARSNFTVKVLPLYPGALVFDGVDDCGVCDNFPILTKEKGYTVVALRSIIDKNIPGYLLSNSAGSNQGAFIFERTIDSLTASFGKSSPITVNYNNPLTYQTTSKYNQKSISVGELLEGGKSLVVGRNSKEGNLYANAAIWELVFLDHDATEEELTKIKDYFVKTYPWLFPDQAWTVTGKTNEDADRDTIANITGNGNNLVLSNFGFAENSGYGLYATNFSGSAWSKNTGLTDVTPSYFVLTPSINLTQATLYTNIRGKNADIPSIKINIDGLGDINYYYYYMNSNKVRVGLKLTNGINILPVSYIANLDADGWVGFETIAGVTENITIEQIPEYEGYLVTDGVDDMVMSSNFRLQHDFTVVGEWQFLSPDKSIYCGISKGTSFILYNFQAGLMAFINQQRTGTELKGVRGLKAICSDGRVYDQDWNEIRIMSGELSFSDTGLQMGWTSDRFTKIAFKNLGFYNNKIFSKDDCIKAYNYLQTLKAK